MERLRAALLRWRGRRVATSAGAPGARAVSAP